MSAPAPVTSQDVGGPIYSLIAQTALDRQHLQERVRRREEEIKYSRMDQAALSTKAWCSASVFACVDEQPTAQLNSGASIPLFGLGTFKADAKTTTDSVSEAVAAALRWGVNHVDCASHHGNEAAVGNGLQTAFKQGFARRDETFITSKLWNTDHGAADVRTALEATLQDLHLSYLDLYLIHWPVTEPQKKGDHIDPGIRETWAAMERLVDQGLVKSIGVSNFSINKLAEILSFCRIRPAVNQVEVHPLWRNDKLITFCRRQGIHVSAYCPLGTPRTSAKAVIRRADAVSKHPLIREMAKKYGKHELLIIMRWGLQHGTSIIVNSSNPTHIKHNLEGVLSFQLAREDYERICAIPFQLRLVDGIRFLRPDGPYRTMRDLWDEDLIDRCREACVARTYSFPAIPSVRLCDGRTMPVLGVSTWLRTGVRDTIKHAVHFGLRHVDVSNQRGNEAEIGAALREVFLDWLVIRPDVWITGKVWPEGDACPTPARMRQQVRATLSALKTDYLDLCLLPAHHDARAFQAAWWAMEDLVTEGLVRSLGIQDASVEALGEVLGYATIPVAVHSMEVHPGNRNDALLAFCRSQGVHVMASSWPVTAYMPQCKEVPPLLRAPIVHDIARRLGKRTLQVLIRWALQHGSLIAPVAGSQEHVQGILDVLNWELPEADYRALSRLPRQADPGKIAASSSPAGLVLAAKS